MVSACYWILPSGYSVDSHVQNKVQLPKLFEHTLNGNSATENGRGVDLQSKLEYKACKLATTNTTSKRDSQREREGEKTINTQWYLVKCKPRLQTKHDLFNGHTMVYSILNRHCIDSCYVVGFYVTIRPKKKLGSIFSSFVSLVFFFSFFFLSVCHLEHNRIRA